MNKKEFNQSTINIFTGLDIPGEYVAKNAKGAKKKFYSASQSLKSSLKKSLWEQWIRLSMEEINNCSSYRESCMAWENSPATSFVKNLALEKMLSLTEKKKCIMHIFDTSPDDSLVKRLAFKKFLSIH